MSGGRTTDKPWRILMRPSDSIPPTRPSPRPATGGPGFANLPRRRPPGRQARGRIGDRGVRADQVVESRIPAHAGRGPCRGRRLRFRRQGRGEGPGTYPAGRSPRGVVRTPAEPVPAAGALSGARHRRELVRSRGRLGDSDHGRWSDRAAYVAVPLPPTADRDTAGGGEQRFGLPSSTSYWPIWPRRPSDCRRSALPWSRAPRGARRCG